jgi:hypothetical protein
LIAIGIPVGVMLLLLLVPEGFFLIGVLALLVPFIYLLVGFNECNNKGCYTVPV